MLRPVFHQKTGADWIEQAFINARAVDRKADLYYNDADWPLLFDGACQQKPALRGVADGLSGKGGTDTWGSEAAEVCAGGAFRAKTPHFMHTNLVAVKMWY